jgi:hypothetical protein
MLAALGQAHPLELVDHRHHRARVDQRSLRELLLRAAGIAVDQGEKAEVVLAEAQGLESRAEPVCHALPVPGQEKAGRTGQRFGRWFVEAHCVTNVTLTQPFGS